MPRVPGCSILGNVAVRVIVQRAVRQARCRIAVIVVHDPFESIHKPMILRVRLELSPRPRAPVGVVPRR